VVIVTGEPSSPLPPAEQATEAPEVHWAVLRDCMRWPESSAYDFSDESVVGRGAACADICCESVDGELVMEVAPDADIELLGDSASVFWESASPDSNWSPSHGVSLIRGNSYIVWTWDNQYFTFKVDDLTPDRVAFEWACLKEMSSKPMSCSVRDGGTHKDLKEEAFFR